MANNQPSTQPNLRAQAAKIIHKVAQQGESLSSALPPVVAKFEPEQAALLQAMVYGSIRHYIQLNSCIKPLLKKPIRKKELVIEALLVLGVYQLLFSRIKEHAIINETVNAVKPLKRLWAKGLINAVLRQVQRQKPQLLEQLPDIDNFPDWLRDKITQAWPQQAQHILKHSDLQAPMSLRLHPKLQTAEYLQRLSAAGIEAKLATIGQQSICLQQASAVDNLPGFSEGEISVQDPAAQLAAELLPIKDGMRVLDCCCAPGGKTVHLLQQADIELTAMDIDQQRLQRVHDNLQRCQLQANILCADVSDTASWFDGQTFDAILLDAPCSGTGVIRRHPDIKLLRRASDINQLVQLQQQILNAIWPCLKPEGYLLYATCSILPDENEQQIVQFLQQHNDAQLVELPAHLPSASKLGLQLLPEQHDGFYYALIKKTDCV